MLIWLLFYLVSSHISLTKGRRRVEPVYLFGQQNTRGTLRAARNQGSSSKIINSYELDKNKNMD